MIEKSDLLAHHAPASQHYKAFIIEPLQYIEVNGLGFSEGNIVKYVSRWRQKGGLDDLKKAKFYIERLIEIAEQEQQEPVVCALCGKCHEENMQNWYGYQSPDSKKYAFCSETHLRQWEMKEMVKYDNAR